MTGSMPELSAYAAKYETLRMAALGEALAPEARTGLMLLLRRGMWGWARALAEVRMPARPLRPSTSTPSHPSKAVIRLFAAMANNPNDRSRP
jgi:hypothetical protein